LAPNITTDPHTVAESNTKCPKETYPKLKIYISELVIGSYQYIPVAQLAMNCIISHEIKIMSLASCVQGVT